MKTRLLQSSWVSAVAGMLIFIICFVVFGRSALKLTARTIESGAPRAKASARFENPEVELLIEELKKQKEQLANREKDLNQLALRLESERNELNDVTKAVKQVRAEFDQNITRLQEQEMPNLKKLAKTYSAMTPEGAAAVFKSLEDNTAVKLLLIMKETETAPLLEALARQSEAQNRRVAALSERLRLTVTEPKTNKNQ